ncbi:hypothetical protein ES702_00047 [subsurface metagenome]
MKALVIGIGGGTGAGKTTVANAIIDAIEEERVVYIQHAVMFQTLWDSKRNIIILLSPIFVLITNSLSRIFQQEPISIIFYCYPLFCYDRH